MQTWNIFCRVIDNHGDIGVCWRLACDLASRGQTVRLWADDTSALAWMAHGGCANVEVRAWTEPPDLRGVEGAGVLLEAFGCTPPDEVVAIFSEANNHYMTGDEGTFCSWINLEYLTAEGFAERAHGLPSPVTVGAGRGLVKRFFYPGFTARTGGLIRESDLLARQARFDRDVWLASQRIAFRGERLISLFCYEPAVLGSLLDQLAASPMPTRLLVTAGRAAAAVQALTAGARAQESLAIDYLPRLSQHDFDHLLWACDCNFVRGEDSLARALWAGRPFVWQIYPQHDGAHEAKLDALLDWLDAPPTLRQFHRSWCGLSDAPLPSLELAAWRQAARNGRDRLLAQDDLTTTLLRFVAEKR
ncbi:MAG: elongation factor P maturation arginine rhamnosyltransferase EarP [Burkholderiales bacterium]